MKKIYIIEDDDDIIDLISIILEGKYELDFSKSVRFVLDNPDVVRNADMIITDFLSNDLTCKSLIDDLPGHRYLIITAYPENSHPIKELLELNNVEFLQKPFNINDLEQKISFLLGMSQS